MHRILLPLLGLTVLLRAQINTPQAGFVRSADASVRPVYGIPASYVLGDPVFRSIDAASFSDLAGLVSARGRLRLLTTDGAVLADEAGVDCGALVNIDHELSTAIAWLPSVPSILYWNGKAFERTILPALPSGKIIGIRRDGNDAKLLALEDNAVSELSFSLESGNLESTRYLPSVTGSVFRQKSFLIFADEAGLEIESADGSRRTIPFHSSDLYMERMASDRVHLRSVSSGEDWVLHVTPNLLEISQLPSAVALGGAK